MSGWDAALCEDCWYTYNPTRVPVRLVQRVAHEEICSNCGLKTHDGIYIRKDPKTQNFPTAKPLQA